MTSFDEMLKKTRKKDPNLEKEWRKEVSRLMEQLYRLSNVYAERKEHNFTIDFIKCKKCSSTSFVIKARKINGNTLLKFYKSKWRISDKGTYLCDKC